jgi:hypothetical protein
MLSMPTKSLVLGKSISGSRVGAETEVGQLTGHLCPT